MAITRPNPPRGDLDDLEGKTVVKTACIYARYDDSPLYAVIDDKGTLYTFGGDGNQDQEDRALVALEIWTPEDMRQYQAEQAEIQRVKAEDRQEAADRAAYERLHQKYGSP